MDRGPLTEAPRVAPFEPSWTEYYARASRRRRERGWRRRRHYSKRRRLDRSKILLGALLGLSTVGTIVSLLAVP